VACLRAAGLLLFLAPLAACSDDAPPPPDPAAPSSEELVRRMYAVVDEVAARVEDPVEEVTFQHLLVGVGQDFGRSPGEAEELAASLFARARAGEDFDLLVKNHTNDVHPGIYTLTRGVGDPPRTYARDGMVPGLGDVAWRLALDELGVSPYDGSGIPGRPAKSPLGFHILKRLK